MTRIALALLTLPLLASPAGAATPYDGLRVELRRTSPARIAPAGSLADQQGRVSLVGANALFGQASGAARPLAPNRP